MEKVKQFWFRIPATVRKPLVLIVGMALVIISPFTGVLPGPGGIPVFLIGVAILSTEFEWAQRLRDWTLRKLHLAINSWKQHKVIGSLFIMVAVAIFITLSIFGYRFLQKSLQ